MDHDRHLSRLTTQTSPTLREGLGIGADTAAELLIIFGDTPDRIHAEAAFAKLCGACPIPASSGMTTGRHRLYRGGHRQAKALLHESSRARTRPTDRILTCRCDTTLVGRGRSSDSRSHSRERPHSPVQLNSEREGHRR